MPPPPEQTDRVDRLAPSAWVRTWRGAAGLTLAAGELEATFLPDLGLLGASLRHQGEEVLALPGGLGGYRRGNVTGLPIHGTMTARSGWSISRVEAGPQEAGCAPASTTAPGRNCWRHSHSRMS